MKNIGQEPLWFLLTLTVLIVLRLLHFGNAIDEPHGWRQSDTAHYIWDYYQSGIDLMEPSVCWMGGNDKVALEFPLPEAIAAVIHKIFGPSLIWSRLFFFALYLWGAAYFYKILKMLSSVELTRISVLIYLALPLGIFYSRAIHVDFSAVLCAHGMLFYAMKAVKQESVPNFLVAMVFATLGFLIKAPYLFYLAIPLLAYAVYEKKFMFLLKNTFWLVLPIGCFVLWQIHVKRLNGAMPDWSFIPSYHKMDDMTGWYFGNWENRFEMPLWETLFGRLKFELLAVTGLPLAIVGIFLSWKRFDSNFMRLWLLGTALYLLIFFTLNVIHDYYQIPFLAPLAYFVALPIYVLYEFLKGIHLSVAKVVLGTGLLIVLGQGIRLSEGIELSAAEKVYFEKYYQVNALILEGGEMIRAHTPSNALVITTFGGLDCRCPNLLYAAKRKGWSIPKQDISEEIIRGLISANATHFALLQTDPLSDSLESFLRTFKENTYLLQQNKNWKVRIFKL